MGIDAKVVLNNGTAGEQTTTVSLWRGVRVSRYFHALTSEGQFSVSSVKKWLLNEESIRKPEQNQIQKKDVKVKVIFCRDSMKTKAVMYMSLKMNLFKIEDSYKNSHGCCAFSRRNCQREAPGIVVGSTPL